jgi:hypothetical protein
MIDLFIGFKGSKWSAKAYRLPMNIMLPSYQLLVEIMLKNLWPIGRHIKLTIKKA